MFSRPKKSTFTKVGSRRNLFRRPSLEALEARELLDNNRALFLSTTVPDGANSPEAQAARAVGLGVDIVTPAQWQAMTQAQFDNYRLLVLGDPDSYNDPTPVAAAVTNRAIWTPVLDGNLVINGTDPAHHGPPAARTLINSGIRFAASGIGRTGMYISLSEYYDGAPADTQVPLLDRFVAGSRTFLARGARCYENAHIVEPGGHPALAGLTDATLSNWGCSVHNGFSQWPTNWDVLAIARGLSNDYTDSAGHSGSPYILARGLSTASCSTVVTNTNDSGPCSLRAAVTYANDNPGLDTISFAIPGTGVWTINLASPLPTITDPVVIDGYTQPGASANTLPVGNNANLLIELNGAAAGSAHGFLISAGNSVVRGLAINRFRENGIELNGSSSNVIEGNFIGTNTNGTAASGNGTHGVFLVNGTSNNTIGGTSPAARNLISGNTRDGVRMEGAGTAGNRVQGNYIGTNAAGTVALPNLGHGVFILNVPSNTVGGTSAAARNLISGNRNSGVNIEGNGATANMVQGNYIGTNANGDQAVANLVIGVLMNDGASNNTIGGTLTGARNLISGNGVDGVRIQRADSQNNRVQGNYIGTNAAGTAALGNADAGVYINLAPSNTIGGTVPEARNLISGNAGLGVHVAGASATSNRVQGNYIGTNASGTGSLRNVASGVGVDGSARDNTIGGAVAGAGNLISGNGVHGITFSVAFANTVQGNYIGTNFDGTAGLGNEINGVNVIDGSSNNPIGGPGTAGNLISANGLAGVWIEGEAATDNRVEGNYIGTNVHGDDALMGNLYSGVYVAGGSSNHIVGNRIRYNAYQGVTVGWGIGNTISQNSIFSNADLGIDLGDDGVTDWTLPYLESAWSYVGFGTFVQGYVYTTAFSRLDLEFFANSDADPSGYGEGDIYLGREEVWTDDTGLGSFQTFLETVVPPGYCLSATATDADGTTWEFSNCVVVDAASRPGGGGSFNDPTAGMPWAELLSSHRLLVLPGEEEVLPRSREEVLGSEMAATGLSREHAAAGLVTGSLVEELEKVAVTRMFEQVSAAAFDLAAWSLLAGERALPF